MAGWSDESTEFYLVKFRNWRPPLLVQVLFYPFFLAGLLVVGILWAPGTAVRQKWVDLSEQRLVERLRKRGRSIPIARALDLTMNGRGSLIEETLSIKDPPRLWWTEDDIAAISPFSCCHAESVWEEDPKIQFFEWCGNRYTNLITGTGLIVVIDDPKEFGHYEETFSKLREQKRMVQILSSLMREHLGMNSGSSEN